MGISVFSRSPRLAPVLSALLQPLQALAGLLRPAKPAAGTPVFVGFSRRLSGHDTAIAINSIAPSARHLLAAGSKSCQTVVKAASPRRLKIVREFEAGVSPSCAGRMVISGRMADVCAELDRMAQKEAASQAA